MKIEYKTSTKSFVSAKVSHQIERSTKVSLDIDHRFFIVVLAILELYRPG